MCSGRDCRRWLFAGGTLNEHVVCGVGWTIRAGRENPTVGNIMHPPSRAPISHTSTSFFAAKHGSTAIPEAAQVMHAGDT